MNDVAVIVAAGSGTRMKSDKNKVLLTLGEKTVIQLSVEAFCAVEDIKSVILVCKKEEFSYMKTLFNDEKINFVVGGKTRQESVMNAVKTIDFCDSVLIHDGARPLVTKDVIFNTLKKARQTGAAATGVFVKDTIKRINDNNVIVETPNRSELIAVHTPQVFSFSLYKDAVEKAKSEGLDFTDDCCLMENAGHAVTIVDGSYENIKITTPEDLIVANAILEKRGDCE